jgi:hypothetical protein
MVPDWTIRYFDACSSFYAYRKGVGSETIQSGSGTVARLSFNKLGKSLNNCCPVKIEGRRDNVKYLFPDLRCL